MEVQSSIVMHDACAPVAAGAVRLLVLQQLPVLVVLVVGVAAALLAPVSFFGCRWSVVVQGVELSTMR